MTQRFEFIVPERPVVKERPRMTRRGKAYTPQRTLDYERAVADAYAEAGGPEFHGYVGTSIELHGDHSVIAVWELGDEGKPYLRGDTDNYIKSTLDGLQRIAFPNDAQVLHVSATRMLRLPE